MEYNYIKCNHPDTIAQLKKLGFVVLSESGGMVTFLNDVKKPVNFSEAKLAYTNKLEL